MKLRRCFSGASEREVRARASAQFEMSGGGGVPAAEVPMRSHCATGDEAEVVAEVVAEPVQPLTVSPLKHIKKPKSM